MNIILGFFPWILYWIMSSHHPMDWAAGTAFLISLAVNARSFWRGHPKILEIGTVIYFLALTIVAFFITADWLSKGAHLFGNVALLLIAVISIIIKKPFALQYAREIVPPQYWGSPDFIHRCHVISWVWVIAFTLLFFQSLARLLWFHHIRWFGWVFHVTVTVGAVQFTNWYKRRGLKRIEA